MSRFGKERLLHALHVNVALRTQLWFHVNTTQGGVHRPRYVLPAPPCVHREGPDVRLPENCNLPSRRRSSEGCEWFIHCAAAGNAVYRRAAEGLLRREKDVLSRPLSTHFGSAIHLNAGAEDGGSQCRDNVVTPYKECIIQYHVFIHCPVAELTLTLIL